MARIGLIEIKSANHELAGLCKISNTAGNSVTVFTTRALFPRVEEELHGKTGGYEWILDKDDESVYSYLKRIERICDDRIDVVVITTLRHWQFMFFRPGCKVLARVSNLNFWFRDTKSPLICLKKMMDNVNLRNRQAHSNAITGPIVRNIMLSNLDGVIVEYPPFIKYIHENFRYRGEVYFLPNRPFEGIVPQPNSHRVRFALPGRIQGTRRDYRLVLRVFEKLFSKYGDLIELHLVGEPVGAYGESIISQCEDFREEGYNVFFSGEYVPRAVLEETLNKADVVISPMQVKYRSVTVEEIYTVTKGTGIFSDVIKCAKPTIVPHTYQLADEIKGSFLTYGDEKELQRLLEDLIEDRERLKNLKKEAIKTSEQFSLARLHESFDKMVGELLDGS